MFCTSSKSDQCAPSDEGKSLRLSLYSFIIMTGLVSIDPGLKRIIHFFVGSWFCVPSFLVTNELHIQNTFTTAEGEKAESWQEERNFPGATPRRGLPRGTGLFSGRSKPLFETLFRSLLPSFLFKQNEADEGNPTWTFLFFWTSTLKDPYPG